MKIDSGDFRAPEGKDLHLGKWPTKIKKVYRSNSHYEALLADHVSRLDQQQRLLYASNSHAVLLIFQAMDAAGKDGVIRHVMSGVNPQGCQVFSYRHPTPTELAHDFLWRCTRDLPERGKIGIFNRSYYEEVLIARVHPEILAAENLPDSKKVWAHRFRSIRGLEQHLSGNGTRVVKFFLHLSEEEQRKRFLERIDDPDKNWKFNEGDLRERQRWKDYIHAYQQAIAATSTKHSPWYIVPADDKRNARLIVSHVILETFKDLDLHYPPVAEERRQQLLAIRKRLSQ